MTSTHVLQTEPYNDVRTDCLVFADRRLKCKCSNRIVSNHETQMCSGTVYMLIADVRITNTGVQLYLHQARN